MNNYLYIIIYLMKMEKIDFKCLIILQTFQLQMLSPSGTVIAPLGQVTQVLKVTNINKVS